VFAISAISVHKKLALAQFNQNGVANTFRVHFVIQKSNLSRSAIKVAICAN